MLSRARALALALLTLASLAGCGGGTKEPAAPAPSDDPVVRMTQLKDQVCACEDTSCIEEVGRELQALSDRFAGSNISEAEGQIVDQNASQIAECVARITGGPEDERMSPPDN